VAFLRVWWCWLLMCPWCYVVGCLELVYPWLLRGGFGAWFMALGMAVEGRRLCRPMNGDSAAFLFAGCRELCAWWFLYGYVVLFCGGVVVVVCVVDGAVAVVVWVGVVVGLVVMCLGVLGCGREYGIVMRIFGRISTYVRRVALVWGLRRLGRVLEGPCTVLFCCAR